jgi:putative protein-disulfide isomerase
MGSLWFQAEKTSGMPMSHRIWKEDPPLSSFPACIAVKSATLQSPVAGELYLRLIREACMLRAENISKPDVLFGVAESLRSHDIDFDYDRFQKDYKGERGKASFRKDWNETRSRDIHRFPSLLIKGEMGSIMLAGYRSYASLVEHVFRIAPALKAVPQSNTLEEFKNYWSSLTSREEDEFTSNLEVNQVGQE